jgi:hypothetical protein
VARDGIEPPTPAFSGLDSFRAIMLATKVKRCLFVPRTAHLLGQEWDKILAGQNCLSHAVLICTDPVLDMQSDQLPWPCYMPWPSENTVAV